MKDYRTQFPPNSRASFNGHNGKVGHPSNSGASVWFYPDNNVTGGITLDWWQLRPELTPSPIFKSEWKPLTEPPTKSGTYIIGHRGVQKVSKYLVRRNPAPEHDHGTNTRYGWQYDPRNFKATHWCELGDVPDTDGPRASFTDFHRGDIIRITEDCNAAIFETQSYQTYVPVKVGPFTFKVRRTLKHDKVKTFVPVKKGTRGVIMRTQQLIGKTWKDNVINMALHEKTWRVWVVLNDSGREVVFYNQIGYNFVKDDSEIT